MPSLDPDEVVTHSYPRDIALPSGRTIALVTLDNGRDHTSTPTELLTRVGAHMNDDNNVEVIKDFTTARKIPQLIGRTPDGKKLPFGPYTVPQAVSGAAVGAILWLLHPLWLGDNIT